MEHLNYLNKFFIKYKKKIFLGFVFVILANILALLPANLIGRSFDLIVSQLGDVSTNSFGELYQDLFIYSSLLILFALTRGLFMFYMRQNIIVVSRDIEYDLKNEIYQPLNYLVQKNAITFFDKINLQLFYLSYHPHYQWLILDSDTVKSDLLYHYKKLHDLQLQQIHPLPTHFDLVVH